MPAQNESKYERHGTRSSPNCPRRFCNHGQSYRVICSVYTDVSHKLLCVVQLQGTDAPQSHQDMSHSHEERTRCTKIRASKSMPSRPILDAFLHLRRAQEGRTIAHRSIRNCWAATIVSWVSLFPFFSTTHLRAYPEPLTCR